ncbi:MAG TPA: ATP-binding protein, partial [Rhizomicrobium sp.]|nr:ATP-binding protein [Rhizomicrobium sp.]
MPLTEAENTDSQFLFDLNGRVRNLGLPANPANSLVPLFEAVSNAIHAMEVRWGEDVVRSGEVTIEVHRRTEEEESHVVGFTVTDNGIGLSEDHWRSFRTSDSPAKLTRGGKGVGRLSWLKAFRECRIVSRFDDDRVLMERSFTFSLKAANPVQDHKLAPAPSDARQGTEVRLGPFESNYEVHCPKKTATIAAKLVGHFLPYLVVARAPRITLIDGAELVDLRAYYAENQARNSVDIVNLAVDVLTGPQEFHIYHTLLKKQLKFVENGLHWMFYAGNERVARQDCIDGQLGLKYVGDDEGCVYVGLVAGPFLDSHVNQERTSFTFDADTQSEIHKAAIASSKMFLSDFIDRVRARQVEVTGRVIRENPQFLPFLDSLPTFVADNFSLSTQNEEEIYVELSRRKLRLKRRIDGQLRSIQNNTSESVEADVQQVTKA